MTIRVLHAVVNMNRGGAETLIMNIYRKIDRSKIQFDFLVHKETGHYEEEIKDMGGRIFRVPYVTEVGPLVYKKALNVFFSTHSDFDIVHAHMDSMSGFVLGAAKSVGIPMRISHSHNTKNEGGIMARIFKQTVRNKILPNATDLIACSEEAAYWLFGEDGYKALILKNGIDGKKFLFNQDIRDQVREQLQIAEDTLVIGHVGRFYNQKNHDYLIDCFAQIHKKNNKSILMLIGDGPLKAHIENKVNLLGLSKAVWFMGIRGDISQLMQAMDRFLFPSLHEGVPLTVIEAQASGLKCIVADTVSRNIDIGANLVSFLALSEEKKQWVRETLKPFRRQPHMEGYFKKTGYEISCVAKELEKYYSDSVSRLMEGQRI